MIEQSTVVTAVVMVVGFIGQAAYLKGAFGATIKNHGEAISELKKTVQHKDTCEAIKSGMDVRLKRLEGQANGAH